MTSGPCFLRHNSSNPLALFATDRSPVLLYRVVVPAQHRPETVVRTLLDRPGPRGVRARRWLGRACPLRSVRTRGSKGPELISAASHIVIDNSVDTLDGVCISTIECDCQ